MFEWIKGAIGKAIGVIDKAVTDKDLKKQLNSDIEKAMLEYALSNEEQLTKRHELDMQSDSWLSKNVRPMTLIFLMFMFVIISVFDGNVGGFEIEQSYIPVYESLLTMVFIFYFGSRGIEKSMKIYNNKDKN